MTTRDVPGFAIGGLSGGESKDEFWRIVALCTELLPRDKPRYLMGVGYAEDLVVCSALGCDMYDCVFPTRTARFGTALTFGGPVKLGSAPMATDYGPIEEGCACSVCARYSRAFLYQGFCGDASEAGVLVSHHNLHFQKTLMTRQRDAILDGSYNQFVNDFLRQRYGRVADAPAWVRDALIFAGVELAQ